MGSLQFRRREFEAHIWNHADDAFQKSFDDPSPLRNEELEQFRRLITVIDQGGDDNALASAIERELRSSPDFMKRLLQLVGLTRNKIIQDVRAITAAGGNEVRVPSKAQLLAERRGAWNVAGPYLARWVRRALEPLTAYDDPDGGLNALTVVTWPGYIRQERAKRQGHEAESRVAVMLRKLDIPFEPEEKADNPLCRDAQIGGISFDIVSPSVRNPFMVVKSTVQTANIGQFGESKAHLEVDEAKRVLDSYTNEDGERPRVVAIVDGVGFRSNIAGLEGVLQLSDEFAQFKTLWKAAVVAAAGVGRKLTVALQTGHAADHADFIQRWSHAMQVEDLTTDFRAQAGEALLVEAGEAVIRPD